MQIESIEWKTDDGQSGCSISAQCVSNLRGAMECTLVPASSPRESSKRRKRQMQVLEGTKRTETASSNSDMLQSTDRYRLR